MTERAVRTHSHEFLWGTAISEYQVSGAVGCPHSNWADWEIQRANGSRRIARGRFSGNACDFKNKYHEYIAIMKELGTNAFRFSVEWSNVEPREGIFCAHALTYYSDFCDALINAGITPMITLHHFTDPGWFAKKGGFENEENISYFVRFCQKVFESLGHKVHFWATINEPNIYMFQGYLRGVFPPGKNNPFLALRVIKNLLEAHTRTYTALKNMAHGIQARIGFVHQYLMFYPYTSWNLFERIPGFMFNHILNTAILNFFKTGIFKVMNYEYRALSGEPMIDFVGLNYYSRVLVKAQMSISNPFVPACYPDEIMTDMPYALYPQGLYDAIVTVSQLNVPIYITENGIPDGKDDRREKFITEYISQVHRACADGYDVRGYYYWSLMDNFEWDLGYLKKFGLCHVDFETKKMTVRAGGRSYAQAIKKYSE